MEVAANHIIKRMKKYVSYLHLHLRQSPIEHETCDQLLLNHMPAIRSLPKQKLESPVFFTQPVDTLANYSKISAKYFSWQTFQVKQ
jgi:hypothetical protein